MDLDHLRARRRDINALRRRLQAEHLLASVSAALRATLNCTLCTATTTTTLCSTLGREPTLRSGRSGSRATAFVFQRFEPRLELAHARLELGLTRRLRSVARLHSLPAARNLRAAGLRALRTRARRFLRGLDRTFLRTPRFLHPAPLFVARLLDGPARFLLRARHLAALFVEHAALLVLHRTLRPRHLVLRGLVGATDLVVLLRGAARPERHGAAESVRCRLPRGRGRSRRARLTGLARRTRSARLRGHARIHRVAGA